MTVLDILADLDMSQLQDVGGRLLHAIYLTKERLDITESLANDANGVKYLTLSDKYKKCVKQQTKLANINSIDGLRIIRLEKKKVLQDLQNFSILKYWKKQLIVLMAAI